MKTILLHLIHFLLILSSIETKCLKEIDETGEILLDCSYEKLRTFPYSELESNITRVKLTNVGMKNIVHFFRSSSLFLHVSHLDLSHNQITQISDDEIAEYFPSLRSIILNGNKLKLLEECAFCGLNQIEHIFLVSCNLTQFPPAIHNRFISVRLKTINLNGNSIIDVDAPTGLSHFPQLRAFYFNGNQISQKGMETIGNSNTLRILSLQNCKLVHIPMDFLKKFPHLDILLLSHNQRIRDFLFLISNRPDVGIRILWLDDTGMTDSHLFDFQKSQFKNLQILRLDHNLLKNPRLEYFSSFVSLNLSHNSIEQLSFANIPSIVMFSYSIDLSFNSLRSIPKVLENLKLNSLNLSSNMITDFYIEQHSMLAYSLEELSLSFNQLKEIKVAEFRFLVRLRKIDFSHNQLRDFLYYHHEFNQYYYSNITVLKLQFNSLIEFNIPLRNFPYLQELDLSYNVLKYIPIGVLTNTKRRKPNLKVRLDNNKYLGEWFVKNFTQNDFSANYLSLSNVDFTDNIVHLFVYMSQRTFPSVETLILSYNLITNPLSLLERFPNLTYLDMSNNLMRSIRNFQSAPKLKEFFIHDNTFQCSCEMNWITKLFNQEPLASGKSFEKFEKMICDNQPKLFHESNRCFPDLRGLYIFLICVGAVTPLIIGKLMYNRSRKRGIALNKLELKHYDKVLMDDTDSEYSDDENVRTEKNLKGKRKIFMRLKENKLGESQAHLINETFSEDEPLDSVSNVTSKATYNTDMTPVSV
ncbi:hypothetical protein SNEBB_009192 [Seison nebaliae]|nr:hypothetical protein SNEBB_009192 [Seison nebaliae]